MHALFTRKVECKMAAAEILAGAANPYHAARTRRVSAPGLSPASGEVVTQFQSDTPRTDSLVRVLHAQPDSRVSTAIRGRRAARCYAVTMQRSFSDVQEHARAVDKSAVPERRRRRFTASGVLVILARQCAQIRRSGRNGLSVAAANSGGRGASKDTRDVRNTQWF
jgi:hypothetical protein